MTRRLRIVIASAVVLVGLLLIVLLSVIGVTHTGFGQDRVRKMVLSMLEGSVKGKVYIGGMSGGFFTGGNTLAALEPSHAIAWLLANGGSGVDLLTLSGRGDKDLAEVLAE